MKVLNEPRVLTLNIWTCITDCGTFIWLHVLFLKLSRLMQHVLKLKLDSGLEGLYRPFHILKFDMFTHISSRSRSSYVIQNGNFSRDAGHICESTLGLHQSNTTLQVHSITRFIFSTQNHVIWNPNKSNLSANQASGALILILAALCHMFYYAKLFLVFQNVHSFNTISRIT